MRCSSELFTSKRQKRIIMLFGVFVFHSLKCAYFLVFLCLIIVISLISLHILLVIFDPRH